MSETTVEACEGEAQGQPSPGFSREGNRSACPPALPCISGAALAHAGCAREEARGSPTAGAAEATASLRFRLAHRMPTHARSGIRRVLRDLRPRARVLAFVSGKGGVGKTNLAVNVGIGLAATGRRVLLVDADLGLANVDLVLGQRPRGDLGHVIEGRMALREVVEEGPGGLRWIPGASQMPRLAHLSARRREQVLEGLAGLETEHDFLLLDAPAGVGADVLALARQADELVLVTTPEPTALMDAYALLKTAAASGAESLGEVRLVVNLVAHRRDAERVHRRLSEAAGRFLGVPVGLLGYVFCDGHVGRAVQKQQPVLLAYPHSQASWCVKRLVGSLLGGRRAEASEDSGFFERMVRRLSAS